MMVITNYITVSRLGWIAPGNDIGVYAAMIVPFMVSIFLYLLIKTKLQTNSK